MKFNDKEMPEDLRQLIAEYLSATEIARFAQTSRNQHTALTDSGQYQAVQARVAQDLAPYDAAARAAATAAGDEGHAFVQQCSEFIKLPPYLRTGKRYDALAAVRSKALENSHVIRMLADACLALPNQELTTTRYQAFAAAVGAISNPHDRGAGLNAQSEIYAARRPEEVTGAEYDQIFAAAIQTITATTFGTNSDAVQAIFRAFNAQPPSERTGLRWDAIATAVNAFQVERLRTMALNYLGDALVAVRHGDRTGARHDTFAAAVANFGSAKAKRTLGDTFASLEGHDQTSDRYTTISTVIARTGDVIPWDRELKLATALPGQAAAFVAMPAPQRTGALYGTFSGSVGNLITYMARANGLVAQGEMFAALSPAERTEARVKSFRDAVAYFDVPSPEAVHYGQMAQQALNKVLEAYSAAAAPPRSVEAVASLAPPAASGAAPALPAAHAASVPSVPTTQPGPLP